MKSTLKFSCALALGTMSFAMPARAEDMPGTKARTTEVAEANPYEAVPRQTIAE